MLVDVHRAHTDDDDGGRFDRAAYVWNPFVEKSVFKMQGHNHPLVKVLVVPNSPQIVTADLEHVVKVNTRAQTPVHTACHAAVWQ